jgi:5-methylcytosine-specific restriction endonuclease McrA
MTTAHEEVALLVDLLRREYAALAEFLVALASFDQRQLWRERGHTSLFNFLHRELGLSKGAAFYRMAAAQLVQRHPEVVEPLRDGRLCLTNVVELSKVVTAENLAEVMPRFFHVSKLEAKQVTAELRPTPAPTKTVVTPVRVVDAGSSPAPKLTPVSWLGEPVRANSEPLPQEGRSLSVMASLPAPTVVEPKTAELSRVHITFSRQLLRKLGAARDALSHSHPGASDQDILEAGLDLLLERAARRKGLVKTPRNASAPPTASRPRSRYIPANVRREVWKRDGGRCQWRMGDGSICGSTHRVQLDHIEPFAKGGAATADKLRCLCDSHNDLAARQVYGDDLMNKYTRPKGPTCKEPVAVYGASTVAPAPATSPSSPPARYFFLNSASSASRGSSSRTGSSPKRAWSWSFAAFELPRRRVAPSPSWKRSQAFEESLSTICSAWGSRHWCAADSS